MSAAFDALRPEQTALVVVDLQNDFCAEGGFMHTEKGYSVAFATAVVSTIGIVLAAARGSGLEIVWVRSAYDFKYLSEAQIAKRKTEGCCLEGTWGAEFYELEPQVDEAVFTKHNFSAFTNLKFDQHLRDRDVKTVVVVGVSTNVCVESTLRDAFSHGYSVSILADCVGSNNEVGHRGTLSTVETNFGTVAQAAELIGALDAPSACEPHPG